MKTLYKCISEHVMFQPMHQFLRYINMDDAVFIDAVYKQNDLIFKVMNALYKFGAFNIVVPLNELMTMTLSGSQLLWWNRETSVFLDNYKALRDIQEMFHSNAIRYAAHFDFMGEYPASFMTSEADMMERLWDSYPADIGGFLEKHYDANVGMLIPGLFQQKLEQSYLEMLDQRTLPTLLKILKQHSDCLITLTEHEIAVIKLAVATYSSELGWRYLTLISQSLKKILQYDERSLCCLRYHEYRSLVFSDDLATIDSFMSNHWVEQIQSVAYYIKSFEIKDYSSNALRYSLPTLLHCVGRNEDASDSLLELFEELSIRGSSAEVFLLALYRAVSLERFSNHQKILLEMRAIFGAKSIPSSLLHTLEDILKLYQALFAELPKRFELETLQELLNNASASDKFFYEKYQLYLNHPMIDDMVTQVKWLYDSLFVKHQLVFQLEVAIKCAKDFSQPYSTKLIAIQWFARMFGLLTSHINYNIRVVGKECLQNLGGNDTYGDGSAVKIDEIFDVYSPSQHKRLLAYNERLAQEMESLPRYSTVALFEKLYLTTDSDITEFAQEVRHLADGQMLLTQKVTDLETASDYYKIITNAILTYGTSLDNSLGRAIMEALISKKDTTVKLYEEIQRWGNPDEESRLSSEDLEILRKVRRLLEDAISRPEHYTRAVAKEELLSALKDLLEAIPGVGNVIAALTALVPLTESFCDLVIPPQQKDSLPTKE